MLTQFLDASTPAFMPFLQIATYDGFTKRVHYYPAPAKVLSSHLDALLDLEHNITQVTVMKADSSSCKKRIEGYYSNCNHHFSRSLVRVHDCENYGYSMGQWLLAYERYGDAFDYYLLMEDDYCPSM